MGPLPRTLAEASGASFEARIGAESFRQLLEAATPYGRLEALTSGSRPSRRGEGGGGVEELRAIPWVLCWTQTRLLLHAWLGAGEAWSAMRSDDNIDERMRRARDEDPLFRSNARLLSFSMAKAEPSIGRIRSEAMRAGPSDLRISESLERRSRTLRMPLRAFPHEAVTARPTARPAGPVQLEKRHVRVLLP